MKYGAKSVLIEDMEKHLCKYSKLIMIKLNISLLNMYEKKKKYTYILYTV